MHSRLLRLLSLLSTALLLSCARAEDKAVVHPNGYLEESPLPKGYPLPGPFGEISRKSYPPYRAAVTSTGGSNRGFWTLFRHIKRQDIAMTAPVEMKMAAAEDGGLQLEEMAFLYRHREQGKTGSDGDAVEVLDLPAIEVLSYAWQGGRSERLINELREKLIAEAGKRSLPHKGFRLLGYNSPMIPDARKTHELQLILE